MKKTTEIRKYVEKRLEELGIDATVQIENVKKNNGTVKTAILIKETECKVVPTIYIDELIEDLENQKTTRRFVVDQICNTYL